MARRPIAGCRALVTGASSGIGWELVRQLAQQGARVLVTARRQERLDQLSAQLSPLGQDIVSLAGDITSAEFRQRLIDLAAARFTALDLLVNNAGVGAVGPFAEADSERLRRIMEVNFHAPVELIRSGLPLLAAGRRPLIVNVGSVLGHRAVPDKSEYCASKFALHGFSDALRAELVPLGIDLLLVSPSTTRSEFFDRLLEDRRASGNRRRGMPASRVARRIVSAVRRGRHEIILSAGGRLLVWLDRLAPALTDRLVARFRQGITQE